ncbi:hypothetical protein EK904_003265, partial [Melospiza melodia maxima]
AELFLPKAQQPPVPGPPARVFSRTDKDSRVDLDF